MALKLLGESVRFPLCKSLFRRFYRTALWGPAGYPNQRLATASARKKPIFCQATA
ncbi:hypothetical protein DFP91_1740 [Pseudorhodoplanes sinuspersici]|nr:hypothetical protein DFP91_1740 [Pseudorhodoplanes sinuspersici]